MRFILTILVTAIVACTTSRTHKSDSQIGPLQNQGLPDGCGCYLKDGSQSNSKYFYWNDFGSKHYVNLKGVDTEFETCEKKGDQKIVGDTQTITCKSNGILVRIRLKKTSICKTNDEGCEFTTRTGTIEFNGSELNLTGGCGC